MINRFFSSENRIPQMSHKIPRNLLISDVIEMKSIVASSSGQRLDINIITVLFYKVSKILKEANDLHSADALGQSIYKVQICW